MNPVILWNNILTTGSLSAAYTAAGYDVANIKDLRPYTLWKGTTASPQYITVNCGSARAADAIGICGHNLKTVNATVSVENSSNGSSWTTVLSGFLPSSDNALVKLFTSDTKQYWRIKITGHTAAPYMGVAILGSRMTFPAPCETPHTAFDQGIDAVTNVSDTGTILGSVVRSRPYLLDATFALLTRSWVFDTFLPFWDTHGSLLKPFFWAFDLDVYPDLVYFSQFTDDMRLKLPMTVLGYIDAISLSMRAVR